MKTKPNLKNMLLFAILIITTIILINDSIKMIIGYQLTYLGIISEIILLIIEFEIITYIKNYINKKGFNPDREI